MATLFLNDESFPVSADVDVRGTSGNDETVLVEGNPEVSALGNIDRFELPGALADYQFDSDGNTITVTRGGSTVLEFLQQDDPTTIAFADGSADVEFDAGQFTLGGATIPTDGPGSVNAVLDSSDTSSTADDDDDDNDDGGGSDDDDEPADGPNTEELSTGDDNINVSAKTEFQGGIGTLTTGDNLDGSKEDGDLLDVVMGGGEDAEPFLSNIETVEVESRGSLNYLNLGTATGVESVKVVDKGTNSADLNITGLEPASPTITLTGDETIGVEVEDDTGDSDQVVTSVDSFNGELNLLNAIEVVKVDASNGEPNAFTLSQDESAEGAFQTLEVTGDKTTTITSTVASLYDYTGSSGDHTLVLKNDNPDDQVVIKGGSGDEKFDFTTTMDGIFEDGHPNSVSGGAGDDQVWIELDEPIDVQPEISGVEAIKLQYNVGASQDATFSARDVQPVEPDPGPAPAAIGTLQNGPMNPVYIIEASTSQVQLLDLAEPTLVEVIGDLDEGAIFDSRDDSSITTRFVTDTNEDPDIVVEGDLEYQDFDNVTIQNTDSPAFPNPPTGDGKGEVGIKNQILLNEASTLTIETTREDDDDADNDGDIVVAGLDTNETKDEGNESDPDDEIESVFIGRRTTDTDTAIDDSRNLTEFTVNAVNGNIFLGDGGTRFRDRDGNQIESDDDALDDARALKKIDVLADNATASIGDIGEYKAAEVLEFVNLTGSDRGVLNLDDINAVGKSGEGDVIWNGAPDGHPYKGGSGARIEDFNVTTAFRSETDIDFDVNGQPVEVGNDIDALRAGLVRNMRLDIAEDGSLSFGPVATNITELNIGGAGDLFMFGQQGDDRNGDKAYPWYVEDIQATNHDGDLLLDFRDFLGIDQDFGSTDFDQEITRIQLGDQDTTGPGIRFDNYRDAAVYVEAGAGNLVGTDDQANDEENSTLPSDVEGDYDDRDFDADAKPIIGGLLPNFAPAYFGLVTGNGDDILGADLIDDASTSDSLGGGNDYAHAGAGDDILRGGLDSDVLEGGTGTDVVDHGASSDGDGAADLHIIGNDVLNGGVNSTEALLAPGLNPEDSYDLVKNFEEGSGNDVTRLIAEGFVNPGAGGVSPVSMGSYTTPKDADMPQITDNSQIENASNVDIFEILPSFFTVNLDKAIQIDNPNGEDTVEKNFFSEVEGNSTAEALSDYLGENPQGVFVLVYDQDTPTPGDGPDGENVNAGLFYVNGQEQEPEPQQENGTSVIFGEEDVQLISVYEGVGAGNMEADDFQLVGVEQNNGPDLIA
jgi:hypothetical protein